MTTVQGNDLQTAVNRPIVDPVAVMVMLQHLGPSAGVLRADCVLQGWSGVMTTVAQTSLAEVIVPVSRWGNLTATHLADATGGGDFRSVSNLVAALEDMPVA